MINTLATSVGMDRFPATWRSTYITAIICLCVTVILLFANKFANKKKPATTDDESLTTTLIILTLIFACIIIGLFVLKYIALCCGMSMDTINGSSIKQIIQNL